MFIDAHAHLDERYFDLPTEEVARRAFEAGVDQLVVVGCGVAASEHAVALAEAHPGRLFAAVGVHPHDAGEMTEDDFAAIEALARRPEVVAVGETGLDYHYDHSPREVQRAVFARFLRLAKDVGKPVVIHTREAEPDTLDILRAQGPYPAGGQLHCFTGTRALARSGVDELDFHVSFSGVVTFNNADSLREIARELPLERLLVETDCPYLTPAPFRGRKNEPALVTVVAGRLAAERGMPLEALAEATTANARRLFGLSEPPPSQCLAFASGDTLHLALHRREVTPQLLEEATARLPLKKVRRLTAAPAAGAEPGARLLEWARRFARERGKAFD